MVQFKLAQPSTNAGAITKKEYVNRTDKFCSREGVFNLSKITLDDTEWVMFNKGLNFIPTPKTIPVNNIIQCKKDLIRNIKIRSFFKDRNAIERLQGPRKFEYKSVWTPKLYDLQEHTINTIHDIKVCTDKIIKNNQTIFKNSMEYILLKDKNNFSKSEKNCLNKLSNNDQVIVKKADKGTGIVLMDVENYNFEAYRQLNDKKFYLPLETPIFQDTIKKIRIILNQLKINKFISSKQFDYLAGPPDPNHRIFYLLPKIHKDLKKWTIPDRMPEGRPIVTDVETEASRVSKFIDSFLAPLANKHPTYIKNTTDFISRIRNLTVQKNCFLVTGDVASLYTNMKHDRILNTVENKLKECPLEGRPDKGILELLELTLKCNDFKFGEDWFLQICGAPMGKAYSPNLANIYLLEFDQAAMENFRIKPRYFFRYLDDIFFLWEGNELELLEYNNFLNTLIPGISITFEYDLRSVNFLDCTVFKHEIEDNLITLQTKVFFKSTDTHQLLHRNSHHPSHSTLGLLKSQFIRFKRISSFYQDYLQTSKILFAVLKNRGYTYSTFWKYCKEVWHAKIGRITRMPDKRQIFPIIVPYNSVGKNLSDNYKEILSKNVDFTDMAVVAAFTNHKNIGQLII